MVDRIFVHFIICLKGKNVNKYWTLNSNENAEVLKGKEKNCLSWSCHVQWRFKSPTQVLGCSQCCSADHMSGDIVKYTGCHGKQVIFTLFWFERADSKGDFWILARKCQCGSLWLSRKNQLILVGLINVNAFWNLNKPCFYSFTLFTLVLL